MDAFDQAEKQELRKVTQTVAALNIGYFAIEFAVALIIGSVALFADSVDFLEDGAVNLLIVVGLGWPAARRAKLGMLLAAIILLPALATLWTAWTNYTVAHVPQPAALSITGLGALAVNFTAARLLAPFRTKGGSLTHAAFLSARNDVIANIAIIIAGLLTAAFATPWPDLITGLAIAALNAGAAHDVFEAARAEHAAAKP